MLLDIWSILIIVIAFQGLFLLSALLVSPEKRVKQHNRYLIIIILVLIWFLTEFFMIRNKINVNLNVFYGTRYGSWFLLGPLTYFYFKSITDVSWKFSKKELLHFVPFFIFVIVIPLIAYKVLNDRQVDYGMLSVFDHREKVTTTIQYVYSFVFILQFIHLAVFLLGNLKLIKGYSRSLRSEYSFIDSKVKWLTFFNISLLALLFLSAIFLYVLLVTDIYRRHLDYIYVLPIGFLFYFISYNFMKAEWKPTDRKIVKYAGSSLNVDDIPQYAERLKHLMKEEKIYLDSTIKLEDLAQRMDMSKHHLSQIINQHFKLSFFDFINNYRTSEAKSMIQNNPEFTMVKVAFESGFNNKTSFVNAFKKFEKVTPSEFRETGSNY